MKRILLTSFLCVFAAQAPAWEAKPQVVAEGVYAFVGETGPRTVANEGMNTTTGFIVTTDGVVVIDSGSTYQVAQKIQAAIQQVTPLPIRYVINTGGQDHRWLGNSYFVAQGVSVLGSAKMAADVAERGRGQFDSLAQQLGAAFAKTKIQPPSRSLTQNETLKLGDTRIELLLTAGGHTPGDLIVWLPQQRIAFAGDLVYVNRLLGVMPMSHVKHWLESFDRLAALAPQQIVPGHGTPTTLAQARHETRDYLSLLRSHMKAAVDQGDDMQMAIKSLDDSGFASLQVYQELRGQNANRAYLEAEAE